MRPTVYLGVARPGGAWSIRDRGLAESLLAWEDGLCPGCGQSRAAAWDSATEGEWDAHDHTCEACKAKHGAAERRGDGAGQFTTVSHGKG